MAAERDLELAVMRLAWRIDALDAWRKSVDGSLVQLELRVGDLTKADEIAQAVADKMRSERTFHLTIVQKVGAGLFAFVLVVLPIVVGKVWA